MQDAMQCFRRDVSPEILDAHLSKLAFCQLLAGWHAGGHSGTGSHSSSDDFSDKKKENESSSLTVRNGPNLTSPKFCIRRDALCHDHVTGLASHICHER